MADSEILDGALEGAVADGAPSDAAGAWGELKSLMDGGEDWNGEAVQGAVAALDGMLGGLPVAEEEPLEEDTGGEPALEEEPSADEEPLEEEEDEDTLSDEDKKDKKGSGCVSDETMKNIVSALSDRRY